MDYYQILGVDKSASPEEIKKAYRKLASQHHPDKGGDNAKFQEIQAAYATLSDPEKRAEYDNPAPQFGPGGFSFNFGPGGFDFGPGHPFADLFGMHQRRQQVNRSLQLQTSITLNEAFTGKEMIANVTLPSGREQIINVKIPAGIHEGTTLRLSGMGDDSVPNLPRGDILLNVRIQPHPIFVRQGDDLLIEREISCIDAMTGCRLEVTSIDGRNLETQVPSGMQHDGMLGLSGFGMPNFNQPGRRGRLLIRIKVRIPNVTEEQKEQLRKLNIQ